MQPSPTWIGKAHLKYIDVYLLAFVKNYSSFFFSRPCQKLYCYIAILKLRTLLYSIRKGKQKLNDIIPGYKSFQSSLLCTFGGNVKTISIFLIGKLNITKKILCDELLITENPISHNWNYYIGFQVKFDVEFKSRAVIINYPSITLE